MGTTKQDKLFIWLTVLHELEDFDERNKKSVHENIYKKLDHLNKLYYIKKR